MKHDHSAFSPAAAYCNHADVEDKVRRFMPMVRKAAWHILGSGRDGLEIDDLLQVGLIALTECARRHSSPSEDGFAAYAKMRVRGAMFDVLRKMAPETRGAMKRRQRYDAARRRFLALNGYEPKPAELGESLGLELGDLAKFIEQPIRVVSIDDEYDEHNAAFAQDLPDPFETLADSEQSAGLADVLGGLPERLQLVLQLYFVEELNLAEIAAVLEVSIPRVHQLKADALKRARAGLEKAQSQLSE